MKRLRATFPSLGIYTPAFKQLTAELGFEPLPPPKITNETIKIGVRHSSDMVCFPFKITLGNLIQALDSGAQVIIAPGINSKLKYQTCRFSLYYPIQEQILKRLGYDFKIHYIDSAGSKILKSFKKINPSLGLFKRIEIVKKIYRTIKQLEKLKYEFKRSKINLGIVGEIYTVLENHINYNIIEKLKKKNIGVHNSITLSWFLKHKIKLDHYDKSIKNEVKKYLPCPLGGHGWESLYNTIWYAKNNFDGVIHLLPLTCMPETLIEMPMNHISEDYKIPIYRFPIDENNFEAGFDTRLETFIKLLEMKKCNTI